MDKEAQENLTEEIAHILEFDGEYTGRGAWLIARRIVVEVLEGYRTPKGKPPLLEHEQMMAEIWDLGFGLEGMEGRAPTQKERFNRIAQAQREADIKYYEG